jgi:ribonuclease HI
MLVYIDGAYSPTTNCGGIGIVFVGHGEYSKRYENTTNQRMELKAALVAMQSLLDKDEEVTIFSDSTYLVNSINKNYKKNKNKDLWEQILAEIKKFKKISFVWLKGHAGDEYNSRADKLAQNARS